MLEGVGMQWKATHFGDGSEPWSRMYDWFRLVILNALHLVTVVGNCIAEKTAKVVRSNDAQYTNE